MLQLVPTPIGNIADVSFRTLEAFKNADIFLCEDTRITKQLLLILKERYQLELKQNHRFISLHSHNEKEFIKDLQPDFFDAHVVYVSDAGMPGVSDPGAALVAYAQEHGIAYEVLPGANAVLSAYVASGFGSSRFLFFGFLPHKGSERKSALEEALYSGYVTILYASPHRLHRLLEEIAKETPTRELFLAKELTKRYERFYKGNAKELLSSLEKPIKGEWVVVIDADVSSKSGSAITLDDISTLDIPKKQKAKLLSKITGKAVKEIYNGLI